MKYCKKCRKESETEEMVCPVCKSFLVDPSDIKEEEVDDTDEEEIFRAMMEVGMI